MFEITSDLRSTGAMIESDYSETYVETEGLYVYWARELNSLKVTFPPILLINSDVFYCKGFVQMPNEMMLLQQRFIDVFCV